jgi:hypothetical protein
MSKLDVSGADQVLLQHECLPGLCNHEVNPLDGVQVASEYDLADFESEVHRCDDACSHDDPMAQVELADAYDLEGIAELAGGQTYTHAGVGANGFLPDVATDAVGTTPVAESVTSMGVYPEDRGVVSFVSSAAVSEPVVSEKMISGGVTVQAGSEAWHEQGIPQDSQPLSLGRSVLLPADSHRSTHHTGYSTVERPVLAISGKTEHVQPNTREISRQGAQAYQSTSPESGRSPVARGESQVVAVASNVPNAATQGDSGRLSSEKGGIWPVDTRAAFAVTSAAAPERFHGWVRDKLSPAPTKSKSAESAQVAKVAAVATRPDGAQGSSSAPQTLISRSGKGSMNGRFMGWAADREQVQLKSGYNQSHAVRGQSKSSRDGTFMPTRYKGVVTQHTKQLQEVAYSKSRPVSIIENQKTPARTSPGGERASLKSERLEARGMRESSHQTQREAIRRVMSRFEASGTARMESLRTSPQDRTEKHLGQGSVHNELRQKQPRDQGNLLSSHSAEQGVRSGTVDQQRSIRSASHARYEIEPKESSRALQREERSASRRLRDISSRLEERLSRQTLKRGGAGFTDQVRQLALNQLMFVHKLLELLEEDSERGEEVRGDRAVRRSRRVRVSRLKRYRGRLKGRKKSVESQNGTSTKMVRTKLAPQPTIGAHVAMAISQSPGGLVGAHTSGPSKSLDIFQLKVDDDSEDNPEAKA